MLLICITKLTTWGKTNFLEYGIDIRLEYGKGKRKIARYFVILVLFLVKNLFSVEKTSY